MNGTTTEATLAMRLSPPITTSATHTVTTAPAMMTATGYEFPKSATPDAGSDGSKPGQKNLCTAATMLSYIFIWLLSYFGNSA